LQPPGYVTQMLSRNYLPQLVHCDVVGAKGALDANAKRSDDGRTLLLQIVNASAKVVSAQIHLAGFAPGKPIAQVSELSGTLEAANAAEKPTAIIPQQRPWKHGIADGWTNYTFPPYSFTVMRFDGEAIEKKMRL
jgi:alpha-L-arabinofuranosidase